MKTTFQRIKDINPRKEDWKKLIAYYEPKSLNEEVTIQKIVKSNGIKHALWAMRAVENQDSVMLFCADVAESVLPIYEKAYPEDSRVRDCIDGVRKFVKKEITSSELGKLRSNANAAADASADASAYASAAAATAPAAATAAYAAVYSAATYAYTLANAANIAIVTISAAVNSAANAAADYARENKWEEIKEILKRY